MSFRCNTHSWDSPHIACPTCALAEIKTVGDLFDGKGARSCQGCERLRAENEELENALGLSSIRGQNLRGLLRVAREGLNIWREDVYEDDLKEVNDVIKRIDAALGEQSGTKD